MGLFKTLMTKIFGHQPAIAPVEPSTSQTTAPGTIAVEPASSPSPAPSAQAPVVDVAAVLTDLASKNSEKLDWKKSIVDLLKLVGMDSSLSARKELAADLHYSGDTDDSASMNIWLHQEVLKKLAANGGKVPADLLD